MAGNRGVVICRSGAIFGRAHAAVPGANGFQSLMLSGVLLIVSAPSGAGKSSLVQALLREEPNVSLSISYTTRAPRAGEGDGREYHFISPDEFHRRAAAGEFVESAEVHGNFYATSEATIRQALRVDKDLVLEIDWQGAQQVRRRFPGAVSVFILPPSLAELERRLRARGQDSDEVIARRLRNARDELEHLGEYDYAILNKDFDLACRDLVALVRATRLSVARQLVRHAGFPGLLQ
jgi:guanylate kinase